MEIKTSRVDYDGMKSEDMAIVDLETGNIVEEQYKPPSDTVMHREFYKVFPSIGGISHTYSINAVSFIQDGFDIPLLGTTTTHVDYFYGSIFDTRELT